MEHQKEQEWWVKLLVIEKWETMVSCDWATATSSSNWSTVVTWNTVALP